MSKKEELSDLLDNSEEVSKKLAELTGLANLDEELKKQNRSKGKGEDVSESSGAEMVGDRKKVVASELYLYNKIIGKRK